MTERQKGIQVHRPIIYGSHARLLTDEEKQSATPGHTHRWTIFLASATSPPTLKPTSSTDPPVEDMDYLPGGHDDLGYVLKRVTFRLHETYANPSRVCDKVPFKVSETGWGEFTVQIRLQFVQESGEKPLTLAHPIKLHHWGAPVEGPPPTPASGDQPDAPPAFAVEKQEEKEGSEGVKAEVQTPVPTPSSPKPTTPIEPTPGTQPPDTPMASQPLEAPLSAGPVSIASKLPVHAWQYDELVFSDPPTSFLSILNANPPTPLPPKNRRARDQRQAHEVKVGQKAKGRTSSISTTGSRQGTTEPMAVDAPALPVPGTPGPGQAVVVGIPGEPGSADVPLEFSQEMEKGEWNRLNDARIKIVAEMDRWRERLIAEEKDLVKLKEEMGSA